MYFWRWLSKAVFSKQLLIANSWPHPRPSKLDDLWMGPSYLHCKHSLPPHCRQLIIFHHWKAVLWSTWYCTLGGRAVFPLLSYWLEYIYSIEQGIEKLKDRSVISCLLSWGKIAIISSNTLSSLLLLSFTCENPITRVLNNLI